MTLTMLLGVLATVGGYIRKVYFFHFDGLKIKINHIGQKKNRGGGGSLAGNTEKFVLKKQLKTI